MTVEEIRTALNTVTVLIKQIAELEETLAAVAAQKDGLTAVNWMSTKVSGGAFKSPQERYIERVEELNNRHNALLENFDKLTQPLRVRLRALSFIEFEVITNRYYRGYSASQTAQLLQKSTACIRSAESRAIKAMSEYNA